MLLKNEKIAKIVSSLVYKPSLNEKDYAIQLLVEKLCIPKDIISYTQDDLEKNILWHLNLCDEVYETIKD